MGYVEGRNIKIEIRATEQYDQLPILAAELVRKMVDLIFAWGSANAALAAKAATATIPIVFTNGSDPVKSGIIEKSMNQPGGNIAGVSYYNSGIMTKRLELLSKLVLYATRDRLSQQSYDSDQQPKSGGHGGGGSRPGLSDGWF